MSLLLQLQRTAKLIDQDWNLWLHVTNPSQHTRVSTCRIR